MRTSAPLSKYCSTNVFRQCILCWNAIRFQTLCLLCLRAGSTTLKLMLSCKFDEMMINLEENINLQLKTLFLKKEKKIDFVHHVKRWTSLKKYRNLSLLGLLSSARPFLWPSKTFNTIVLLLLRSSVPYSSSFMMWFLLPLASLYFY